MTEYVCGLVCIKKRQPPFYVKKISSRDKSAAEVYSPLSTNNFVFHVIIKVNEPLINLQKKNKLLLTKK